MANATQGPAGGPARPKTSLQVLPNLISGGVERGAVDVAQALVQAGWRAIVVSAGGPMVRELERAGAEHIVLPLNTKNPMAIRRNAESLTQLIRDQNVDIVHARSRAPAWSAREAARAAGVPYLTTFHGIYSVGPFGVKKLYNRVMADGDLVIAVSEFVRDHVMQEYGVAAERIRVIHRGVDVNLFDAAKVSPTRLIQVTSKWRLQEATQVVMLPGRLTALKGHDLLIDAIAELKRRGGGQTPVRCLMVGQDHGRTNHRDYITSYAAARGVDVHIVDDCNDMAAAYMATDVVVSASTRPEAFGRVVAEAQAMGRPVVAPSHGPSSEIIVPGVTGWLFTPSDPVSLADALERALNLNEDERLRVATAATARARTLFNKPEMCAKTLDVYNELLERHLGGSGRGSAAA
jgi:glycosyltransferase involved in cell wall biosynthesis